MTRLHHSKSVFDDRFTRGFAAGLVAGLTILPLNFLSKMFFGALAYADFAGILIYGHKPHSLSEVLLACFGVIFFEALLGGIFAHLIIGVTSKNLYLKGWAFSCFIWFGSYAITLLYKVPEIMNISFISAFSNFISATIWGLVLANVIVRLNTRYNRT